MAMSAAGLSFFFNVGDFAAGGQLAIPANDAPTTESSKAEKPNETHHVLRLVLLAVEQYACR
jgi:hypothetical protein